MNNTSSLKLKKVLFICENEEGDTTTAQITVNLPDYTFDEMDLTQIVKEGIQAIHVPIILIRGKDVICQIK